MREKLIIASALLFIPLLAKATPPIPNDCWFGVMTPSKAAQGKLAATEPVAQWRVGTPLVLYSTKETNEQLAALAEKGQTGTFDTSKPITVIQTQIFGPEPGDKDNPDEARKAGGR